MKILFSALAALFLWFRARPVAPVPVTPEPMAKPVSVLHAILDELEKRTANRPILNAMFGWLDEMVQEYGDAFVDFIDRTAMRALASRYPQLAPLLQAEIVEPETPPL